MATVFISHAAKEDAQFAHRLAADLRRLGVQVWIAPESIRPGEGWVRAIERGLAESSHVVVVLTPAALESKWVEKETDVAIARERQGTVKVVKINVDENTEVAGRMGIRSIPSVMLFQGGELKEMLVGARPQSVFDQMLDRALPSA